MADSIGASEFAALVNSRDGASVRKALQRFVTTIKLERRIALSEATSDGLGHTDDDSVGTSDRASVEEGRSDDDTSDEEVPMKGGLSPPAPKRYKKDEAWKEDSASYNVPFVGTSVSSTRQRDAVVPGEWPTGLLKAYLIKSPLAVELTGDIWAEESSWMQSFVKQHQKDRAALRKSQELVTSIKKAHLGALSELITAAIPLEKLGRNNTETLSVTGPKSLGEEHVPRFLPEIVTKRLPGIVRLLAEETGQGKGKTGLSGEFGGCGPLAAPALAVLTRLCSISSSIVTARHVARALEQSLPDGVLRFIVTSSVQPRSQAASSSLDDNPKQRDSPRIQTLAAGLTLASTLLERDDAVVFSCIGTSGAKDRKIRPGLLFLALHRGLPALGASTHSKAYLTSISHLFRAVRGLLNRSSTSNRSLVDIFSRDCVQNICSMALVWAPPLVRFEDVLEGLDAYDESGEVEAKRETGIEARRLLFTLLANPTTSPLLKAIQVGKKSSRMNDAVLQIVVRTLAILLDDTTSLVEVRRFVLHTISIEPDLLPALFRILTMPDATQRPFAFATRMNCLKFILRQGPSAVTCLGSNMSLATIEDESLFLLFVPSVLKKATFAKALQHANHLVALEALQFFSLVVARCGAFLCDGALSNPDLVTRLSDILKQLLPDVPVLVAALSKLRFQKDRKSDVVMFAYVCHAVRAYLGVFPTTFDWTKLLPSDAKAFAASPTLVQKMILSAASVAEASQHTKSNFSSAAVRSLLEIATVTRSQSVLQDVRNMLVEYLSRIFGGGKERDASNTTCDFVMFRFELTSWVDGMTREIMDEFCSLLQTTHSDSPLVLIELASAWHSSGLPNPIPNAWLSAVLVRALLRLPRVSESFALLTAQVCIQCMMRDPNPLPLCVIVANASPMETGTIMGRRLKVLGDYARAIVYFDRISGFERHSLLLQLLKTHFASGSYPLAWLLPFPGPEVGRTLQKRDTFALANQTRHMASVLEGNDQVRCRAVLRRLLPLEVAVGQSRYEHLLTSRSLHMMEMEGAYFIKCLVLSGKDPLGKGDDDVDDQSMTPNETRIEFNCDSQFELLYLYIVAEFLPYQAFSSSLHRLLRQQGELDNASEDNSLSRLLEHFLLRSGRIEYGSLGAAKLTASMLKVWFKLTTACNSTGFSARLVALLLDSLADLISSDTASLALLEYDSELLVRTCIIAMRISPEERDTSIRRCLLSSMISTDPCVQTPAFFRVHYEQSTDPEYVALFRSGRLDLALCTALNTCDILELNTPFASLLVRDVKSRADDLVSTFDDDSFQGLIALLYSMSRHSSMLGSVACPSIVDLLLRRLSHPVEAPRGNVKVDSVSVQDMIVKVAVQFCTIGNVHSLADADVNALTKALVTHLGRLLSRMLRSGNNLSCRNTPEVVLAWLLDLLPREQNFRAVSATEMSSWAIDTCRACLRYGMGGSRAANIRTSSLCLDFVGSLVSVFQRKNSPLQHLRELLSTTVVSETFDMVTSHSQFQLMLQSNGEDDLKLRLVRILVRCLLASAEIKFDVDVWNCVLASYTAGVTAVDTLMRLLVHLYGGRAQQPLLLHHLRWGASVRLEDSGGEWDWLVEAIELHRIHATLDSFPIDDILCPSELDRTDAMAHDYLESEATDNSRKDQRYSPAFLLPLVLAALQSGSSVPASTANSFHDSVPESGGFIAQFLCGKGALALAMASLTSESAVIRKMGLAIIGLFSEALNSRHAHQMVSWRERPQIAMALNAVQRALTVRFAEDKGDRILTKYEVPILPGFSAIFLAKASLMLSRPSDPLFLALNRAFLRTESDGGAFQDLTRLPAFMTLFCSSSDEPERLMAERKFAIELVNMGLVHEESYKLLVSCHCPELLLNAIQCASTVSSMRAEDEIPLLFRTIQKLVACGGERASTHLLVRLGLLAWLRAFAVENRSQFKPSFRLPFVRLLTLVTRRSANLMPPDEFESVTAGLAEIVLSLFMARSKTPTGRCKVADDFPSNIIACEFLPILAKSRADQQTNHASGFEVDGVQLETAAAFISRLETPTQKRSGLTAICVLPSSNEPSDAPLIKVLCVLLLDSAMTLTEFDSTLMLAILQRVALLTRHFDGDSTEREALLSRLLNWRRQCCRNVHTRFAWKSCLESLTDNIADETVTLSAAKSQVDIAHWVVQKE